MNIGIVGSRRRDTDGDYEKVRRAFITAWKLGCTIVSGGCPKGADRFAEILAEKYSISTIIHRPNGSNLDTSLLRVSPRAAYAVINYARNTLIAQDSDILIACVAADRKGGTEDTIKKYLKMGKKSLILV